MARIVIEQITSNSFVAYIADLDTNYPRDDRSVYWYKNGSVYHHHSLSANISSSIPIPFSNLESNTTYYIDVTIYYKASADATTYEEVYLDATCTTLPSLRPALFSWTYTKKKGGTFNLTATEWNNLTANINAVRTHKGLLSYSFTTAYKGYQLTANMYNECIYAIGGMMSYNIASYCVSSGDIVTADSLNLLVTLINSIT